jgi:hypothetical protein
MVHYQYPRTSVLYTILYIESGKGEHLEYCAYNQINNLRGINSRHESDPPLAT